MSMYDSSGGSSGYAHVARPCLPDIAAGGGGSASRVTPWFHGVQAAGATGPARRMSPASSASTVMPYAGGLVPPARVHHITRPPPTQPPPPPPTESLTSRTAGITSSGSLSSDYERRRVMPSLQHQYVLQQQQALHQAAAAVDVNTVWGGRTSSALPSLLRTSSAGAARLSSPPAEPVCVGVSPQCGRFNVLCCRVLCALFATVGVCGGVLVLIDLLLRHRWPHVDGLLFVGVMLVLLAALMLPVLCRRQPPLSVDAKITGHSASAAAHATPPSAAAVAAALCVERIPLTAVACGDNVYVESGRHATLPRRHSPPPLASTATGCDGAEYSHPWDHLIDCSRHYSGSELPSSGVGALNMGGSHGYANTVSLPR